LYARGDTLAIRENADGPHPTRNGGAPRAPSLEGIDPPSGESIADTLPFIRAGVEDNGLRLSTTD
jgi:hypothetical protein